MEITLAAVTLGIALLVGFLSLLLPALLPPSSATSGRPKIAGNLTFGLLVILLFFFLALLKVAPFSPGQSLGWGWLIGGLTGLLLAALSARMISSDEEYYPYRNGLVGAGVLAALALTLLLFRGDPGEALLGCALGIAVVAGIFRASTAVNEIGFVSSLEAGAFLAVTLAAGTRLAIYHFASREARGWWVYLLALAALWLLAQALAYFINLLGKEKKSARLAFFASTGLVIILSLVLGWLLASRLEPAAAPGFIYLLLVGLGTALLLLWLSFERPSENPAAFQPFALAALLMIFLVVLTYKLQAGFGAGVALTAAWGIGLAGLAWPKGQKKLPISALAIGANFLLLRLFLEQTGVALEEVELSFHYTLIGLLLGIILPFVYGSLQLASGRKRTLVLGALALISPLLLLALWGPDAVLGMLVGLFAAQALALLLSPLAGIGGPWASWQAPLALLTLGMALVGSQASRAFGVLYQLPRTEKIYLAGAIALFVILWAFAGSLAGLRHNRMLRRAQ